VFATRVTTNPPTTMEIDLASDGENGALDSEDSGISDPRIRYEFPEDVLRIIFDCIGPGHYLYLALVCKKFCALYKERSLCLQMFPEAWSQFMMCHVINWNLKACYTITRTAYRNEGASITCATFAMNANYNLFHKSEWRVYLISGAIRMNRPLVVEWMFCNGWFDYITAHKCAKLGLVEVILWMWIRTFPFLDDNEDEYNPTLVNFFRKKGDIWLLNIQAIIDSYHVSLLSQQTFFVRKVYDGLMESYQLSKTSPGLELTKLGYKIAL
jgi:hypothetical protein